MRQLLRRVVLWFRRVAMSRLKGSRLARTRLASALYTRAVNAAFGDAAFQDVVFRGVTLRVPSREVSILPGLVAGDYESDELDTFERLCAPGAVVLDVGANVGIHTVLAARHDAARVLAVEPVPANIKLLVHNVGVNAAEGRVEIIEAAAGDAAGELILHLSADSVGTHSADPSISSTRTTVQVVRLDDELATRGVEHIDIVKIDVEGYELHCVRGLAATLRRDRPALFIELNGSRLRGCGTDPRDLVDVLFELYAFRYTMTDGSLAAVEDPRPLLKSDAFENLVLSPVALDR